MEFQRATATRSIDRLNRMAAAGSSLFNLSSHVYAYDLAGQRRQAAMRDGAYWSYNYDTLGQVSSAKKRWSDGTWVPGMQFEYLFDTIGNRTSTKAPSNQS